MVLAVVVVGTAVSSVVEWDDTLEATAAAAFRAVPCVSGMVEQAWTLSPGVTPGGTQSVWTNVKMNSSTGGCWEVTGCSSASGADVGCGYGCKPLPRTCSSKCDCNGCWSLNSNGTITSCMDGHCLQVSGAGSAVNVGPCTGKPNQRFVFRPAGGLVYTVTQSDLCIQGRPPPPPPPPPCGSYSDPAACPLGRCVWENGKCVRPPPPPPTIPPTPPPLPPCDAKHTCADNGLSVVPPMGWRSWNVFAQRNDDAAMRAMMAAMTDKSRTVDGVPTSLLDVGYVSVGMDDGWQQCNCSTPQGPYPHSSTNVSCSVNDCRGGKCTFHDQTTGRPLVDKLRFPDLAALVAYGHSLGLQVGFYLNTCICMEKGRTYFEEDVAFMAEMKFDTVKIDQCGSAMNMSLWAALINGTGRPMMIENCHNRPSWWSPGADAASVCDSNMWRSGGDINPSFEDVLGEAHALGFDNNVSADHPWGHLPLSRPGCWGYPDMMEVGNFGGLDPQRFHEERTHFGLWCIVSSPLVLGFNLSNSKAMDRVWPIITNREAIAVDHAWAGFPGTLHKTLNNETVEVWAKPLPKSNVAVLVINTANTNVTISLFADDVPGSPKGANARDVWNHMNVPVVNGQIPLTLAVHDSAFLVLSGTSMRY